MQNNEIFLTAEGKKKLQEELRHLRQERRPDLVKRISVARDQGDLAENSEYHHAREELSFTDGRIEELKDILSRAKMIKKNNKACKQVGLGCKVVLGSKGKKTTFHLVGEWEADPASAKISHSSPLGKALMGQNVGSTIEFEAPAGKITYTILAIE